MSADQAFRLASRMLLRYLQDDHDHEEEVDHAEEEDYEDHLEDEFNAAISEYTATETDKPWADALLGAFLVFLVTFSGLLLTAATQCFVRLRQTTILQSLVIPSFAAGALLATTVFLLIPESLALLLAGGVAKAVQQLADEHTDEMEDNVEGDDAGHDDHEHLFRRWLAEEEHHDDDEHEGENGAAWKFGTAIMGGFLFPILLHAIFPAPHEELPRCQDCEKLMDSEIVTDDGSVSNPKKKQQPPQSGNLDALYEAEDDEGEVSDESPSDSRMAPSRVQEMEPVENCNRIDKKRLNIPLAMSILLGDFFHNVTDGVFIGTAFILCSKDIAYTILATTIYHEIAQELADYVLLTHHCGFPIWLALIANATCGLSVIIGVVIIFAANLSNEGIGIILAISAGVYLYITAVECIPKVQAANTGCKSSLIFFACFTFGAVPIGLVLLNHGHCDGTASH